MQMMIDFDFSVAQTNDPAGVMRNILFMRDQNNRIALSMNIVNQIHDFGAGF